MNIPEEASRQVGKPVTLREKHISLVRASDTVFHNGKAMTVCRGDLKRERFMGHTLFGDSYRLGTKPVLVVEIETIKPSLK